MSHNALCDSEAMEKVMPDETTPLGAPPKDETPPHDPPEIPAADVRPEPAAPPSPPTRAVAQTASPPLPTRRVSPSREFDRRVYAMTAVAVLLCGMIAGAILLWHAYGPSWFGAAKTVVSAPAETAPVTAAKKPTPHAFVASERKPGESLAAWEARVRKDNGMPTLEAVAAHGLRAYEDTPSK